jgi:predicted RNA-binding Zn ribbon-like protein
VLAAGKRASLLGPALELAVAACTSDECLWAFYDRSRNRSRHWCSMGVCGNRAKTRTYRAKRSND